MEASESFYKQRIEALENNIEYLSVISLSPDQNFKR